MIQTSKKSVKTPTSVTKKCLFVLYTHLNISNVSWDPPSVTKKLRVCDLPGKFLSTRKVGQCNEEAGPDKCKILFIHNVSTKTIFSPKIYPPQNIKPHKTPFSPF